MDLALAFVAGFFSLPFLWMIILALILLGDVVCCETEYFGLGAFLVISSSALAAWLGNDINVFGWAWGNLGAIIQFTFFYLLLGTVWSVVKWYFYLLKIRDEYLTGSRAGMDQKIEGGMRRPESSFARNNKTRIMGWIAHWPFSIVGTFLGDFLTRIFQTIYEAMSGLYDRIAGSVFADFDK